MTTIQVINHIDHWLYKTLDANTRILNPAFLINTTCFQKNQPSDILSYIKTSILVLIPPLIFVFCISSWDSISNAIPYISGWSLISNVLVVLMLNRILGSTVLSCWLTGLIFYSSLKWCYLISLFNVAYTSFRSFFELWFFRFFFKIL